MSLGVWEYKWLKGWVRGQTGVVNKIDQWGVREVERGQKAFRQDRAMVGPEEL